MANSHSAALDKPIGIGHLSYGLKYLPGVILLLSIGLVAKSATAFVPNTEYVIFAIAIGAAVTNTFSIPAVFRPGIRTYHFWLKLGIVLMGSKLALQNIAQMSVKVFFVIAVEILLSIALARLLARAFGLSDGLGSMLGIGVGVCGVSAIVAATDAIKTEEEDLTYAIATILIFGAITVFLYPLIGSCLNMPEEIYGYWVGLAMNNTAEAIAAGFALSPKAGAIATVLKLARNSLLGIVILVYALIHARAGLAKKITNKWTFVWSRFPKFVLGSALLSLLTSLGLFTADQLAVMGQLSEWALMLSFAGVGMSIQLNKMRAGLRPFLLGLSVETLTSVVALCMALLLT